MNKKGQNGFDFGTASIAWPPLGIGILIGVIALFTILVWYRGSVGDVPGQLQSEFIALRFAEIPECFAYQVSGSSKVVSSSIDLSKFTQEHLNKCYRTQEERGFKSFNFRLVMESSKKELATNNYFHHDNPDLTIFKEVLVWDKSTLKKDTLIIYVQEKI